MSSGLEARTDRGRSILDLRYADLHPLAHGVGIHRATLFDLLHGRLLKSPAKLVTGAEIVDVDKTHLVEENGARHGPFDLIVAADGVHSGLRARLLPHVRAPLYHWGCMWTTVPDLAGIGAAGLLRQRVRGTKLMMGLLPVGRNEVTIYWSLPIRALGRSKTIDLAAWRRTATALWPEAGAIIDRAAAGDFARATYRHVALSPLERGPGAVHRRRRARHQPAARPGRQSRPDGCLGAGQDARRRARAADPPSCASSAAATRPCATTAAPAIC